MRKSFLLTLPLAAVLPIAASAAPVGSAADVAAALQSGGYAEFREIELDDGLWEVEVRRADGRWSDIHVDPASGEIFDKRAAAGLLDAEAIRAALAVDGYTDIRDLDRDGAVWSVEASDRSGQRVELRLAGTDGRVLHSAPDDDD